MDYGIYMGVVTRFAPSPTGFLHIGNARTALIAWLFARKNQGKYILRIDDTDRQRSEQRYVDAIKQDLEWLGLDWDQEVVQSERMDRYNNVRDEMVREGRLYPCYESSEELQVKKKLLLGQNKPPIYDRASMVLSTEQKLTLEKSGITPHYRFLLKEGQIAWHDLVRGPISFDAKNLSDPVLIRADGSMTYSIASVVDDIDYKITHIIRGEDHSTNSATHVQLFQAMNAQPPEFAHISLLKSKEGGISKRYGGFEIKSLREQGFDRMAVLSLLAKMGTSDPIEVRSQMQQLIEEFSISKQAKSTVTYDIEELLRLNAQILHNTPFSQVETQLKEMGMVNADELFWHTVRPNVSNLSEAKGWYDVCCAKIMPNKDDLEFTKQAASLLPEGEFSQNTWEQWTQLVKSTTGRSGKSLFMPIRKSLTGMEHGPELKFVLMLLGREKAWQRLNGIEE